jgi:hypothetical protein
MRRMTRKAVGWTAALLAVVGAAAYALIPSSGPLRVQLLDVSGFTDDVKVWMPFRFNVGLTNQGRELLTITRVHVEPDFDDFNEAYNVGAYEVSPPLRIEPGSSATYQAATTLLNATQLDPGSRHLILRVRVEANGEETTYEFPAEFDHVLEPKARTLRY